MHSTLNTVLIAQLTALSHNTQHSALSTLTQHYKVSQTYTQVKHSSWTHTAECSHVGVVQNDQFDAIQMMCNTLALLGGIDECHAMYPPNDYIPVPTASHNCIAVSPSPRVSDRGVIVV